MKEKSGIINTFQTKDIIQKSLLEGSKSFQDIRNGLRTSNNLIKDSFEKAIVELMEKLKVFVDYEKIEKVISHNSLNGWTLTGDISAEFYFNEDNLLLSSLDLDALFKSYYENDGYRELENLKKYLLKDEFSKWNHLLTISFDLYHTEKYRISIPALIAIVEGEMSELMNSHKFGKYLFNDFEKQIDEKDKFLAFASYSMYIFLKDVLFKKHKFEAERKEIINRNWVLHGRDEPKQWTKIDLLRLWNTIASIRFLKEMKSNH
ncbi:hypothetical protein [Bacillus glycinifermentans]|uniref:Uncharacterized protein n=1 Tax=Bacillus glycinifermentans TaxID=1664069 RepID=A0AAJ3YXR8_9BACI|nr:hypothetical protein [Bacillus glycinifermentans]QAT65257.1 hypothetical protein EQZ20_10195 [Bacillus glycinifermentans]SCA85812.1 hypothetical protein BGLY_1989 [Bacillus glycinifermentans]